MQGHLQQLGEPRHWGQLRKHSRVGWRRQSGLRPEPFRTTCLIRHRTYLQNSGWLTVIPTLL